MRAPRMEVKFIGPELDNWQLRQIWGSMNQWDEQKIDENTARLILRAKDAGRHDLKVEFQKLMGIV